MNLLLRKDRPWIVGFAVAGTIALAAALCDRSGVSVFVVGHSQLEAAFHVAWIAGLLLGVVAACFDEILGTREFLRQRPISWRRIAVARAAGCAVVLATWFVLAPIGAWLVFATFDESAGETRWASWSAIHRTLVVAVSSCTIGLAAGALPGGWLLRLVVAAGWYLAAFGGVHCLTTDGGITAFAAYGIGHLVVAAIAIGTWWTASAFAADPDRPWPARVRTTAGVLTLVAAAQLWAAVSNEAQSESIRALHGAWPSVAEVGPRVLLVRRDDHEVLVVDAEHRATGEPFDPNVGSPTTHGPEVSSSARSWGFDAPRWHWPTQYVGWFSRARVMCAADGHVWVQRFDGRVAPTGKGADLAPFEPDVRLEAVRDDVLAWEAQSRRLWRHDAKSGWFVPVPLPDDDPVVGLDTHAVDDEQENAVQLREALQGTNSDSRVRGGLGYVRGTKRGYVLDGDRLRAVDGLLARVERSEVEKQRWMQRWGTRRFDGDPLEVAFALPATPQRAEFRHVFVPRTAREQWHACAAMVVSATRPPLLQAAVHWRSNPEHASWLTDRLVLDGRRPWLVACAIAVSGALAWALRRRLRRLGASTAVIRSWMAATLLLGPVAFFVHFLFERRRAWARQAVVEPARPPRIVTPHVAAGVSP